MNGSTPAPGPPTHSAAVRVFEHGGPEVLTYGRYPLWEPPETGPGPEDVVVDVHAIGVTGFDVKYRRGVLADHRLPGRSLFPLPQQLGREAAGVVRWTGSAVTTLTPGDRVVAVTHPEDPHGADTARGLGNLSAGIDIPGHQSLGSYARFLVRDQRLWLPVPPSVELEQAAVTLWPYSTAHRILADRLHVGLDDVVIVLGSSGAMGIAAIQLAALMGARPVAATRDPAKATRLKALGAVEVIDTGNPEAAVATVHALTSGRGAEHLIDFAGDPHVLAALVEALRVGAGICVGAGEENPDPVPIRVAQMIGRELNLLGIRGARRADMLTALELLELGRIHTPIAHRFPLARAADAHTAMEHGLGDVGRILLIPDR